MNEIVMMERQLPNTLADLSKYALIGREKLTAVRAEMAAINKLGLAREVYEQKLAEAQEIAELVTRAEVKVGEMLAEIPKATTNHKNLEICTTADFLKQKPKSEVLKEIGINQTHAERLQKMAAHPDIVEMAIAEARESDDIVSRSFILGKIQETKKPHVSNNSGENEWYTPTEYIEAARKVMGSIDLDPASCEVANRIVKAKQYYTIEDDGLSKPWLGNIWLNPPYSSDLIGKFVEKAICENYDQAIVLVNNATETNWFQMLITKASAVVFPKGRVRFYMSDGKTGAPLQGQAVIYLGGKPERFLEIFSPFGWGAFLSEG